MVPVLRGSLPMAPLASTAFNRLDSLLDRFFTEGGDVMGRQVWSHIPLSIWSDENNLYIEAEAPGVLENDLEITVHGDVLSIRMERREDHERNYLYNGRFFGRFERAVALPEAVDTDQIEATLTNGVLHLTLPKKPEAKTKKIALKTS